MSVLLLRAYPDATAKVRIRYEQKDTFGGYDELSTGGRSGCTVEDEQRFLSKSQFILCSKMHFCIDLHEVCHTRPAEERGKQTSCTLAAQQQLQVQSWCDPFARESQNNVKKSMSPFASSVAVGEWK